MLDHSFEMLLKAAIRRRSGRIRKAGEKQTIGFSACVRKGLTDANLKILTYEQALTLQAINGQRDAAHHYLVDMSEHQLYFYAQAGVTLFRDIHDDVFDRKLVLELPERVLPISTTAPKDLTSLFDQEVDEIKGLLAPGTRRKMDAIAKVRSLSILECAVNGDHEQPSDRELEKVCKRLTDEEAWRRMTKRLVEALAAASIMQRSAAVAWADCGQPLSDQRMTSGVSANLCEALD